MKNRVLALIVVCVFLCNLPFSGFAQSEKQTPYCGTATTRNSSWLLNGKGDRTAPLTPFNELLIFVNFNLPQGTQITPGFDNADLLRSSLLSSTRTFPAPLLSASQKTEVLRRVKDDFSPFNIRVTTDQAEFTAYDQARKFMCLVSTSPTVGGFPNGTAGVSPFTGQRIPNSIVFVFSQTVGNNPIEVANTVSHEIGHSLAGLPHQHLYNNDMACQIVQEYHPNFGTGALSFGPLMGAAIGGFTNWWAQPCIEPTFGVPFNDFVSINNQVVLRPDDFPNGAIGEPVTSRLIQGILEQAADVDFIRVNFKSRGPITVTSDNIDLKVTLYNRIGVPMGEFDDPNATNVTIPATPRVRYISVQAGPNPNIGMEFMTGTYVVNY